MSTKSKLFCAPNKLYWATFNRIEFQLPLRAIVECSHSGACDQDVEYWFDRLQLKLDPEKLREELRDVGAWDSDELSDHDQNVRRIIWIGAGNLSDEISSGNYQE